MYVNETKEVYFGTYCKTCEYFKSDSGKDPCDECLSQPWNTESHKPINYKEKEKY